MLLLVAATVTQVALGTGSCDGMGHTGSNDGIREGSLSAPCKEKSGKTGVRSRASWENARPGYIGREKAVMVMEQSAQRRQ